MLSDCFEVLGLKYRFLAFLSFEAALWPYPPEHILLNVILL